MDFPENIGGNVEFFHCMLPHEKIWERDACSMMPRGRADRTAPVSLGTKNKWVSKKNKTFEKQFLNIVCQWEKVENSQRQSIFPTMLLK